MRHVLRNIIEAKVGQKYTAIDKYFCFKEYLIAEYAL